MSESFYGGRRGAAFSIKKSYNSVEDLIADFKRTSCVVGYGEYGMVSNTNYGLAENNLLYQRDYDGSARLAGNIFPPAPKDPSENTGSLTFRYDNYSTIAAEHPSANKGEFTLGADYISGKESQSAKWINYSYTDSNGDADVAFGMQLPYVDLEFSAEVKDNYTGEVFQKEDTNNPLYQKYHLTIPRSKGDSFHNMKLVTAQSLNNKIDNKEIYYSENSDSPYTVKVADDGSLYIIYDFVTNTSSKTILLGQYKTIYGIQLTDKGELQTKASATSSYVTVNEDAPIKWLSEISNNTDYSKIIFKYNTEETYELAFPYTLTEFNYDQEAQRLTLKTNKGDIFDETLKWIDDVDFNTDTGVFTLKFNNAEEKNLGALNFITKTVINTENYHLLVKYSQQMGDITYNDEAGWYDLGSVKDDNGVLVGAFYKLDAETSNEEIISALNTKYPTGLDGKIVAAGIDEDDKILFAFDYNTNAWKFLGDFNSTSAGIIAGKTITNEQFDKLPMGSLWLYVPNDGE